MTNGSIYLAGPSHDANFSTDIVTVSLSTNGAQNWLARLDATPGGDDLHPQLAAGPAGAVLVYERVDSLGIGTLRAVSFDPDGQPRWSVTHAVDMVPFTTSLSAPSIYVGGVAHDPDPSGPLAASLSAVDGSLTWVATIPSNMTNSGVFSAIAVAPDDATVALGGDVDWRGSSRCSMRLRSLTATTTADERHE